ncbi:hypothetical protein BCR34DRAFT_596686 [Clohesyomyces aquaticus]|uniref:Uncharacterized protein n=1 Tax=Clohesyomyces aquaticus TaxID=1231657 RepID=A0A1Y2A703_9PLEO|nr:hypothetical protein BCR34DRAFT_596686 [Clohesyomyces aquaticus]
MVPGKTKQEYAPMVEFDEEIGDGEDWQLIDAVEKHSSDEEYHEYPKEYFTGTWEGAMANTKETVKEVKAATQSFYGAVSKSGFGKTGFAIGSALANTASRGALSGISLAVAASRVPEHQLPGPVKGWLKKKEDIDQAKARAENAERARLHRKLKMEITKDIAEGRAPFAMSSRRKKGGRNPQIQSSRNSTPGTPSPLASSQRATQSKDVFDPVPVKGATSTSRKVSTPSASSRPIPIPATIKTPGYAVGVFKSLETPALVRRELECFPLTPGSADDKAGEDSPYSSHGSGPYVSRASPSRPQSFHQNLASKPTKSPAADSGYGPSPPIAGLPKKAGSPAIMVEYTSESDRSEDISVLQSQRSHTPPPPAAETEEESSENVFAPKNRLVRTPLRTVQKDEKIKEEKYVDEENLFVPRHLLSRTLLK